MNELDDALKNDPEAARRFEAIDHVPAVPGLAVVGLCFVLGLALSLLSGCTTSLTDEFKRLQAQGAEAASGPLADVIELRCGTMTLESRAVLKDAVDARLTERGSPHRAPWIPCDSAEVAEGDEEEPR